MVHPAPGQPGTNVWGDGVDAALAAFPAANLTGTVNDARLPSSAQAATLAATYAPVALPTFATGDGVRYLSTTGSDANHGRAPGQAKLTLQAAHDSLPAAGGTIIGSGTFNSSTPIVLTKCVTLQGPMRLIATAGNLFNMSTVWNGNIFRDLYLQAITGHVINVSSGLAPSVNQFHNVEFVQYGTGYSVWNMPNGGMIGNLFFGCRHTHDLAATVPTWFAVSSSGGINCNTWQQHTALYSGMYAFHLEETSANTCNDNIFEKINFEVCNGGAIRILSGQNNEITKCSIYDLTVPAVRDLFVIGKSATGNYGSLNVLRQVSRRGGSLAAGVFDINLTGGKVSIIENCNRSSQSGFAIECAGTQHVIINSVAVLTNNTWCLELAQGAVKTGRDTTANRPTLVTGGQWFDTTLSKPIWWNGTVWKDAMGTTV
jgi:hypothetical protein